MSGSHSQPRPQSKSKPAPGDIAVSAAMIIAASRAASALVATCYEEHQPGVGASDRQAAASAATNC